MKQCQKAGKNFDFFSSGYKYLRLCNSVFLTAILMAYLSASAQNRTVGVISATVDTGAGYTLFAPLMGTETYLIDNLGRKVNSWKSDKTSGASDYLLEDGSLLRCESMQNYSFNGGGSGGRVKRTSWDGKVMWTYDYSDNTHCQQHDIEYLPNGNILLLAWESKTAAEASARGRTTNGNVWMDHIVEVKPSGTNGGEIVWEWHVWDHLIQDKDQGKSNYGTVKEHPELVDINYKNTDATMGGSSTDWLHTNAVFYNAEFDQILVSVLDLSEVWIIDHSTTTAEAASHSGGKYGKGGDLLYRFGNPATYKSGSNSDRVLFLQHDPHWIPKGLEGAGNVLVFNNGTQSRGSSIDEFKLPVDADGKYDLKKAPEKVWSYAPSNFYSTNLGSAQRLPNGNTLICQGPSGTFTEVTSKKNIVWKYISPVTNSGITKQGSSTGGTFGMQMNQCFRACRYAPDFAGFKGKTLTPAATPLEGGSVPPVKTLNSASAHTTGGFSITSQNVSSAVTIDLSIPQNTNATVKIFNADGHEIATLVNQYLSVGRYSYNWNTNGIANGVYFAKLITENYASANRIVLFK